MIKAKNNYRIEGDFAIIELTRGQETIIDLADLRLIAPYRWCANRERHKYYAVTRQGKRKVRMHRLILDLSPGERDANSNLLQGDHQNHNTLDNRRTNLRLATNAQNKRNHSGSQAKSTSGYLGVTWRKDLEKWEAKIEIDGKKVNLGYFADKHQAALAYDHAAQRLFKEFATLNFPAGAAANRVHSRDAEAKAMRHPLPPPHGIITVTGNFYCLSETKCKKCQ